MSSSRSKRQKARRDSVQTGTSASPLDINYSLIPYSSMNHIDSSLQIGFMFESEWDRYVAFKHSKNNGM